VAREPRPGERESVTPGQFLADLSHADLQRLRTITRHKMRNFYNRPDLTNAQLDEMIAHFGAEAANKMLKKAIDQRLIG